MWLIVSIAGGVLKGDIPMATTELTANLSASDTVLHVRSTNGLPDSGFVVIGTEKIGYSNKTATTISGSVTAPMIRGYNNTVAAAHLKNDRVRTLESSMMNQSAMYNTALITDASGSLAFVTVPLAVFRLLGSYLSPPMEFLGTDLEILIYIWWALLAGMILAVCIALAGARRV
jgi:hypothetical protein